MVTIDDTNKITLKSLLPFLFALQILFFYSAWLFYQQTMDHAFICEYKKSERCEPIVIFVLHFIVHSKHSSCFLLSFDCSGAPGLECKHTFYLVSDWIANLYVLCFYRHSAHYTDTPPPLSWLCVGMVCTQYFANVSIPSASNHRPSTNWGCMRLAKYCCNCKWRVSVSIGIACVCCWGRTQKWFRKLLISTWQWPKLHLHCVCKCNCATIKHIGFAN